MHEWPLFECTCHHLEVQETDSAERTLNIVESVSGPSTRHRLHRWRTDNPPPKDTRWVFETDATIVPVRLPPKGSTIGWSRSLSAGHLLIPIPDRFIPVFNWMERVRVQELKGSLAGTAPGNRALFECQNDQIVVTLNGEVKHVLPRSGGFRNLQHLGVTLRMP